MPDCRSATINSDTQRQSSGKKNLADLNDRHDHACATGRRFKARLPPFLIQIVALHVSFWNE
jgi:hypothetical protein